MKRHVTAAVAAAAMVISASGVLSGGSVVELSAFRAVAPEWGDDASARQGPATYAMPPGPSEPSSNQVTQGIEAIGEGAASDWIKGVHSSGAAGATFTLPSSTVDHPFLDPSFIATPSESRNTSDSRRQVVEAPDGTAGASPNTPATGVPLPPALWGALGTIGGIALTLRLRRRTQ